MFCGSFLPSRIQIANPDPNTDPGTPLKPDPLQIRIWIQIRIHSTEIIKVILLESDRIPILTKWRVLLLSTKWEFFTCSFWKLSTVSQKHLLTTDRHQTLKLHYLYNFYSLFQIVHSDVLFNVYRKYKRRTRNTKGPMYIQCCGSGSVCFLASWDPLVRVTDPDQDPSTIKQKEKPWFLLFCDFFMTFYLRKENDVNVL